MNMRKRRIKRLATVRLSPARYQITPRAADVGGGWRLRCFSKGIEVFGGAYPETDETDSVTAQNDALEDAENWLARERELWI